MKTIRDLPPQEPERGKQILARIVTGNEVLYKPASLQ
jgi:hypothetical protein